MEEATTLVLLLFWHLLPASVQSDMVQVQFGLEPAQVPRAGTEEQPYLSSGAWPTHLMYYRSQMSALSLSHEQEEDICLGFSHCESLLASLSKPVCYLKSKRPDYKAKLLTCICPAGWPEEHRGGLQQRAAKACEIGTIFLASSITRACILSACLHEE